MQTSSLCLGALMTPLSCTPHFVVTLQVRELQFQGMLASSSSSQHSVLAAGKAQQASTSRDASKPAAEPSPSARHGNADSAAAAAAVGKVGDRAAGSTDSAGAAAVAAVSTVGSASAEDTTELGGLRAEVDRLQTERGLLAAKLGDAQQQLEEARKAIDQKEGHLQGLQVSFVL